MACSFRPAGDARARVLAGARGWAVRAGHVDLRDASAGRHHSHPSRARQLLGRRPLHWPVAGCGLRGLSAARASRSRSSLRGGWRAARVGALLHRGGSGRAPAGAWALSRPRRHLRSRGSLGAGARRRLEAPRAAGRALPRRREPSGFPESPLFRAGPWPRLRLSGGGLACGRNPQASCRLSRAHLARHRDARRVLGPARRAAAAGSRAAAADGVGSRRPTTVGRAWGRRRDRRRAAAAAFASSGGRGLPASPPGSAERVAGWDRTRGGPPSSADPAPGELGGPEAPRAAAAAPSADAVRSARGRSPGLPLLTGADGGLSSPSTGPASPAAGAEHPGPSPSAAPSSRDHAASRAGGASSAGLLRALRHARAVRLLGHVGELSAGGRRVGGEGRGAAAVSLRAAPSPHASRLGASPTAPGGAAGEATPREPVWKDWPFWRQAAAMARAPTPRIGWLGPGARRCRSCCVGISPARWGSTPLGCGRGLQRPVGLARGHRRTRAE